jgi:hypothetical protein
MPGGPAVGGGQIEFGVVSPQAQAPDHRHAREVPKRLRYAFRRRPGGPSLPPEPKHSILNIQRPTSNENVRA